MANERILIVGKIEAGGEVQWSIAALQAEEEVIDGELQRLIDEAADTEDYIADIEDRAIWRRGNW